MGNITVWTTAFFALVVLSAPATAATLKVGRGKPYETIADAVADADAGDKVVVYGGRHVESVATDLRLRFVGKKGATWHAPTYWDSCLTLGAGAAGTSVSGFRFVERGKAIVVNAEDVTVSRCVFRGLSTAIEGNDSHRLTIDRCDLRYGSDALDVTANDVTLQKSRVSYFNSSPISIQGDRFVCIRSVLSGSPDDDFIEVRGDHARVEKSTFLGTWNSPVAIWGDHAVVRNNHFDDNLFGSAILVRGDDAVIERNDIDGCNSGGIEVSGQRFAILRNRIRDLSGRDAGIEADNSDGLDTTSAVVADNVVDESSGSGIRVIGQALVENNTVLNCAGSGYVLEGFRHLIRNCIARGIGGHGFDIRAAETTVTGCTAAECDIDGFRVTALGENVSLKDCSARECTGDGLHNESVGRTTLRDCTFLSNRRDVGAEEGAVLVDDGGNRFDTGGFSTEPIDMIPR